MRLTVIILLAFNLQVGAVSLAQTVTLKGNSITLKTAFKELRKQTGLYFIYNDDVIRQAKPVSINAVNKPLNEVLDELFKEQNATWSIASKVISVKLKSPSAQTTFLQDRIITGVVTSEDDGLPLPGVSVRIKGTNRVTATSVAGVYRISAPQNAVLQFSFLGFATKEVQTGMGNQINVVLSGQSKELKEVVIAYGTTTNRAITNSVATISAKDLENRSITNLSAALEGAAPGIQTSSSNGQPGEGPTIRIRGFGSINGNMNPLFVVDGAPYDDALTNINPDDIESISVLKDASSAALYGARAANGVVLITTKRGRKDRSSFLVKLLQGVTSRSLADYETLNAYEYYPVMWEALRNNYENSTVSRDSAGRRASDEVKGFLGYNPFNVANNEIVLPDGSINPQARLLYPEDLDWKAPLRNAGLRSDYSMSLSGGGDKNDYYLSLGYVDDQGFSIKSDFKRTTARIRVNSQPKKWLKTGLNFSGALSNSDRALDASGLNENPFYIGLRMGPIYPVHAHNPVTGEYLYDRNGDKIYDTGNMSELGLPLRPIFQGRNLIPETELNEDNIKRNTLGARPYAEISFLKNFSFSLNYAYDLTNYDRLIYDNNITGDAAGSGRATKTRTVTTSSNLNQLLNYRKKLGKHLISAVAGHEFYKRNYSYESGTKKTIITDASAEFDNFVTTTNLGSYTDTYRTEGYFSRLEYSYDDKYIISGSYRRDGSSRFSPQHRWGNFYSAGVAWNIDKEKFFNADWIDVLKIRSSYGRVGNDDLGGYYLYQGLYDLGLNNGSEGGILFTALGNPNLEWEKNASIDAAVDFSMLRNRISGTAEVFHRQTDALLFSVPQPLSSGVVSVPQNIGSMRNRGIELQLSGVPVSGRKFKWNIDFNWTTFQNRILSLPQEQIINDTKKLMAGHSRYDFWLYDYYGVDPADGTNLYRNPIDPKATSNVRIIGTDTLSTSTTYANKTYIGSAVPDFYGTVGNTFSYKNFSLQFLIVYQYGGKVYDSDYATLMGRGSSEGLGLHRDILKRWQNPGDITSVPKMSSSLSNGSDNSRWLTDASYLNFRSASLTYTIPRRFLSRLDIRTARAYLSGENLFMLSRRKGLDPSQTFTGVPSYNYAPTRIISLGINLSL